MSCVTTEMDVDGVKVQMHELEDECINRRFGGVKVILLAQFTVAGKEYETRSAFNVPEEREIVLDNLRACVRRKIERHAPAEPCQR